MNEPFKTCSKCGKIWNSISDYILDKTLVINGYQANFVQPENGLILATHHEYDCDSTLSVYAQSIRHLSASETYQTLNKGKDTCKMLCVDQGNLEYCGAECSMAWVREVIQYMREHRMPEGYRAGE